MIPFLADSRYLRINNRFVLIVYRPNIWEKNRVRRLFDNLRNELIKRGIGEVYIGICNARGFDEDSGEWGADALVEFPPHGIEKWTPDVRINGYLNPNFVGHIRSTEKFINDKLYLYKHNSKNYFRGAMPLWDNTARKAYNGAQIYKDLSPLTFRQWLTDIIGESKRIHSQEENIIFINAWNESMAFNTRICYLFNNAR